jgi:hypothetical protein
MARVEHRILICECMCDCHRDRGRRSRGLRPRLLASITERSGWG